MCLLEVNGRCEYSTCGYGQAFDNQRKTCVCAAGRMPIGSGCLTQAEAKQYCGKGAFWGPRGCEPIRCNPGLVLDLESEQCVKQTASCAPGTALVVNQGQSACVPVEQSCARDEFFDPNQRACAKLPTCPTGYELDTTSRSCVQVTRQPTQNDDRATTDVAQWSRANFGPEGGPGGPGLCGPLARKPLTFGVLPGGSVRLVISLSLAFPGGVTDGATVASSAIVEASGQPVTPKGAQEIQATADGLLSSLRGQKARATAPQHNTLVKCLIVNGAPPQAVPSTGGA